MTPNAFISKLVEWYVTTDEGKEKAMKALSSKQGVLETDVYKRQVHGIPASPVGRGAVRNLVGRQTHTPRKGRGPQMGFDFFHGARMGAKGVCFVFVFYFVFVFVFVFV